MPLGRHARGDPYPAPGVPARHRPPHRPLRAARQRAPRARHGYDRGHRDRHQAHHRAMITIKSPREIETMAAAGRIVAATLALVARHVRPGVSTEELDRRAEEFIRSHPGARPSFKGLYDYPATLCTSIKQEVAEGAGYSVVRELVGHGIGSSFHEEPQIPNYGKPKRGPRLVAGMTIAIEPMVNVGGPGIRTLDDKWTVVTEDGSLSAHFEHTVAVVENGGPPRILTLADRGPGVNL